jgi:hypothetical protein
MFNFKKQQPIIEVFDVSLSEKVLKQKQKVWAWVEYPSCDEWREVIYDGNDLCLKYKHKYFTDNSLHRYRRLPQNVKYFVLTKDKPNLIFTK